MTKIIDKVDIFAGWINSVVEFAVTIGLIVLFSFTMFEVGGRYVFGYSQSWIQEAVGYLLSFITFFGVSCLVYKKDLMRIDILYNRLSEKVRKILNIIFYLLIIYYSQILISAGYSFAEGAANQRSSSLVFRLSQIRLIIPIAGFFIAFQAFNKLLQEIKKTESSASHLSD